MTESSASPLAYEREGATWKQSMYLGTIAQAAA